MKFEQFDLERNQSLFEHKVDFNLSESGVHPLKLTEILSKAELENLLELQLSYGYTNGTKTAVSCTNIRVWCNSQLIVYNQ